MGIMINRIHNSLVNLMLLIYLHTMYNITIYIGCVVTVPSPPQASIRRFGVSWNSLNLKQNHYNWSVTSHTCTNPNSGPPSVKSNTWRGFSNHWNVCIKRAPWLPPLRGLMKTSRGLCWLDVRVGFICNHNTFSSTPQSVIGVNLQ